MVVVGGGPVGLATALDLGLKGVPVLVLDDQEGVGEGSRAICFAKRTLEICARLGAARPMLDKGVQWNKGKVFRDDRLLYEFNLLPEGGHEFPPSSTCSSPTSRNSCMTASWRPSRKVPPSKFAAATRWRRWSRTAEVPASTSPLRTAPINLKQIG
ncbi:FAD-dependent monooxygenase [Pannonibacter sp. Pt2-lr]